MSTASYWNNRNVNNMFLISESCALWFFRQLVSFNPLSTVGNANLFNNTQSHVQNSFLLLFCHHYIQIWQLKLYYPASALQTKIPYGIVICFIWIHVYHSFRADRLLWTSVCSISSPLKPSKKWSVKTVPRYHICKI